MDGLGSGDQSERVVLQVALALGHPDSFTTQAEGGVCVWGYLR